MSRDEFKADNNDTGKAAHYSVAHAYKYTFLLTVFTTPNRYSIVNSGIKLSK